jgi:protein phosphatase
MPSLRLHPVRPATGPTHFEPQTEDYFDELIEEDERRARRRRITWLTAVILLVVAILLAVFLGYQWTQSRYYVGQAGDGNVAIFQGVQQTLGPIALSHVYDETETRLSDLTPYQRQQVKQTINADSLADAERIIGQLAGTGK